MSYVKFLVGYNTVVPAEWTNNASKAFNMLSTQQKSTYLMEQALISSFIVKLYLGRPPILLNSFIEGLKHTISETKTEALNEGHAEAEALAGLALNLTNGIIPEGTANAILDTLTQSLNDAAYPHISDMQGLSFYKPYLQYYGSLSASVSVRETVSLPTFALRGDTIYVGYDTKFMGYSMTEEVRTQLSNGPYPIVASDIFGYLAGYNWKGYTLMTLLGVLSTYCFDLDSTNVSRNSYETIYKVVKSVITGYSSSISPYVDSLATPFDDTAFRRILISFIVDLRKLYGLKLDDAKIIAKLIGNDTKENIDGLVTYLTATTASDVGVESLKAFRDSIFSDFEELDIKNRSSKKKEKTVVSSQKEDLLSPTNIKSLKETLDALYKHDMGITEPAPLIDKHTTADESDAMSTTSIFSFMSNEADNFQLDMKDQGDAGDVGATGDDDTPGTESDADKDPSVQENGNAVPQQGAQPGQQEQPDTHVPDLPEVSDKKGVKLELSSSESTDTVFYRLELKTYINSILANPPKSLSVEKIEILKKIKAYWINTLAPQCVHDILNTVIKLPKMFQIHTPKRGK